MDAPGAAELQSWTVLPGETFGGGAHARALDWSDRRPRTPVRLGQGCRFSRGLFPVDDYRVPV
jgi:hypothetical protein